MPSFVILVAFVVGMVVQSLVMARGTIFGKRGEDEVDRFDAGEKLRTKVFLEAFLAFFAFKSLSGARRWLYCLGFAALCTLAYAAIKAYDHAIVPSWHFPAVFGLVFGLIFAVYFRDDLLPEVSEATVLCLSLALFFLEAFSPFSLGYLFFQTLSSFARFSILINLLFVFGLCCFIGLASVVWALANRSPLRWNTFFGTDYGKWFELLLFALICVLIFGRTFELIFIAIALLAIVLTSLTDTQTERKFASAYYVWFILSLSAVSLAALIGLDAKILAFTDAASLSLSLVFEGVIAGASGLYVLFYLTQLLRLLPGDHSTKETIDAQFSALGTKYSFVQLRKIDAVVAMLLVVGGLAANLQFHFVDDLLLLNLLILLGFALHRHALFAEKIRKVLSA